MHVPTLKLGERPAETPEDEIQDLSSEDEAVANDLDLHQLILGGMQQNDNGPIQTAEEVIKEIDDIMDEQTPSECGDTMESEAMEKAKEVLGSPLYENSECCAIVKIACWLNTIFFHTQTELKEMTITQLNDIYMEMEVLIREFSESLINELARRDELEYEKELKNTFISLLLAVQNKRRQFHVEKKKTGKMQSSMTSSTQSLNGQNGNARPNALSTSSTDPKYLTTVIPYHLDAGPPDNQALQVLIKSKKNRKFAWDSTANKNIFRFSFESDQRGLADRSDSFDRLHPEGSLSDVNTTKRAYANLNALSFPFP